MSPHQGAGALAIEIEIPHMKLALRSCKFLFISAIDCLSQTKLSIIRNPQRIVVILSLDDRQHWSKDLLLFNSRARPHVGNYRGFDKETLLAVGTAASQQATTLRFALFDVTVDCLESLLVNDRTHGGCRISRLAHLDPFSALDNPFQQRLVNFGVDDRARAGGTFLALK